MVTVSLEIALFVVPVFNQTILELAIDKMVKNISKKNQQYSVSHIHSIVYHDMNDVRETYASKTAGYYTIEQVYRLINETDNNTCNEIKEYMQDLFNSNSSDEDRCEFIRMHEILTEHNAQLENLSNEQKTEAPQSSCCIS